MALVGSLLTMLVVSEALIYFIRFTSDVSWFLIGFRLVRIIYLFDSVADVHSTLRVLFGDPQEKSDLVSGMMKMLTCYFTPVR
jgi:uncharacterized membrane protein YedE/YeeE